MNTTVSETTTVEATRRPVRSNVIDDEMPLNSTVNETTTIEAIAVPAVRRSRGLMLFRTSFWPAFFAWRTHFSDPVRFDTQCSFTRSSGRITRTASRPNRRRNT